MIIDTVSAATATQGGQSASDQQKLEEDLFNFLNLLVTQLQAQDPLDPMDANEFTSQLVQFANVEQQIHQNAHLETLVSLQQNGQVASMVNYLGTIAEAQGETFNLADGNANFSYSLAENAEQTTIVIRNAAGNIVHSVTGETDAGRHAFTWNGLDDAGNPLPDGTYDFEVSSLRPDGTSIEVQPSVFGHVTGAAADGGKVTLYMGDVPILLDNVLSVRESVKSSSHEVDGNNTPDQNSLI